MTPNFNEIAEGELKWPLKCLLEVTLDGKIYIHCEQEFLIYSSKLTVQSIDPKNASVKGGTRNFYIINILKKALELFINIDPLTSQYLKHLTVGF